MDGFPTVKDSLSSLHIVQKHSVSSEGNHISQRGQVRSWLFCSSSSILRALRAILLSAPTLAFILKHTELTDEVFSNPSTLPISLCLWPPKLRHRYIAMDRASFSSPRPPSP